MVKFFQFVHWNFYHKVKWRRGALSKKRKNFLDSVALCHRTISFVANDCSDLLASQMQKEMKRSTGTFFFYKLQLFAHHGFCWSPFVVLKFGLSLLLVLLEAFDTTALRDLLADHRFHFVAKNVDGEGSSCELQFLAFVLHLALNEGEMLHLVSICHCRRPEKILGQACFAIEVQGEKAHCLVVLVVAHELDLDGIGFALGAIAFRELMLRLLTPSCPQCKFTVSGRRGGTAPGAKAILFVG